ncbi:hypothetical protein Pla22_24930 [Rubripirellula amarantea]|uniref:DUF4956 domain-containing protein n=1 Tax=Rubripirellula amarantea TaxID=2527999 RepID=A0A5C5WX62_9BACT|nr:DUF4956 domain-containing protein [Rubripirellula amarantea]TWT54839.1 hypothetical protein Pla22_24930 [Rubripirellula amarantea]
MPTWLTESVDSTQLLGTPGDSSAIQMALRLSTAFLCGCVIAAIYWGVRPRDKFMPTFPPTLVLLSILCAMLPLVIGQNVAWAFGLVGALSIVRFRTVVEDTHDITFVIFAVLVGMAVGADQITVALVGMTVTGLAAFLVRPRGTDVGSTGDARLEIRIGVGRDPDMLFRDVFEQMLSKIEFSSGSTSKQGASLDLQYNIRLRPDANPTDLLNRLNLIEGVQSVELRTRR